MEKDRSAHRTGIIILILILCLLAAVTAYRYVKFMREDPAYCNLCHIVEEGFKSHERSPHYLIKCQNCHEISMIEGNRLLMAYSLGGRSEGQEHGRLKPWRTCSGCHMQDVQQGAVTMRKSFGHARHVFMQSMACAACHAGSGHAFSVEHRSCLACHKEKTVHGMGTAGTYCLNCHSFADTGGEHVSQERCFGCHKDVKSGGAMSRLPCFDCHSPHERLKLTSADCLAECHGGEARVGMHGLHLERAGMQCLGCHKPHVWAVGEKAALTLCARCHKYRRPETFIY